MRRVLPSVLLVMVLAINFTPIPSFAEEYFSIKTGFMKGKNFMALSSSAQSAYAMGVVDGMLLAPLFKAPKVNMDWLERCIVGMTNEQVSTILRKELEKDPGTWDHSVHSTMYNALLTACPGSSKDK